ncbi:hydrolase, alpha/beta domain protein [Aeromicrobium marinum DSM 15272]|uniref:Hydrolase, alpha/beta domain protein n=1 Tax=Aeromicrobium marinum DSM 15272 TaxID=585531 RepID=E2SBX2_9ACTN|nr:alpha/beta hydrolase [Aeromicrobium marinum]EFQ83258.1 hydrolase, alpha/beta domain protein [Aeromicrobium marinum DSM 15272]
MRSIAVGDLTFDVHVEGPEDGPPVMLLHGFPETSASWSAVTPLLTAAGLRVFAPDQRGYSPGARPDGVEAYSTSALAEDVVGLADGLGLDTFHLVGHDWGSAVAWCVAAHHGSRLRSLTAVSVPHLAAYGRALRDDPDQQAKGSYIGLLRQPGKAEALLLDDDARRLRAMYGPHVPTEQVERYVEHLSRPGALTAALNWYRAMGPELGSLPAVDVPTTFVWSDEDQAIGRASADGCAEFVTGDFTYLILPGVSHWVPEQAPEALAEAIITRAV